MNQNYLVDPYDEFHPVNVTLSLLKGITECLNKTDYGQAAVITAMAYSELMTLLDEPENKKAPE